MGVYSNTDIKEALRDGTIVCTPLHDAAIAEASLDVTLGYHFYKQEFRDDDRIYNPFDPSEVERYFKGPLIAKSHLEWVREKGINPFANIPDDHPIIVLAPGERILAHTHEFVGIRANGGACEIKSR